VNQKVLFDWDERIRSVSFEPPAFGNYTGFAWPWLWFAAVAAPLGRRWWPWLVLAAFTITIIASQSRTGLLMLGVNCIGLMALSFLYARSRSGGGGSEAMAGLRMLLPVAALLVIVTLAYRTWTQSQGLVDQVVAGDSVSNHSRLAFQTAGLAIFQTHPLFGVGLGQFGFHVAEALPSWGFLSPEVRPMITFPEAPWPNVYSIYVRLAAELGLVGVVGWCLLWLGLFFALASRARAAANEPTEIRYSSYPIAMNCLGVLASGIASDTFRTPMLWVTLGLACAAVRMTRGNRTAIISRSAAA
jgi:O-antigen ligase